MARLIELTNKQGNKILVNPDFILRVLEGNEVLKSILVMTDQEVWVKENNDYVRMVVNGS